jgi:hypothetical protein
MDAGERLRIREANFMNCSTRGATGPTGPAGSSYTTVAASYYSMTTQSLPGPLASPAPFSYSGTFEETGGITRTGGPPSTRIVVPSTGVYEAWYSVQMNVISGGGGSTQYGYIWLAVNGNPVANSNGRVAFNSNNSDILPIVPYIISLNAGDYIEFIAQASSTNLAITALTASDGILGPDIPSIIVGIKKI